MHDILGQDFGEGVCVRIPLDDGRRKGVQGVLIEALAQLEGVLARHGATVESLLDVPHVAVCKCCRDVDESLSTRADVIIGLA